MGAHKSQPQSLAPHRHTYLSDWQTIDHISNYNLVRNVRTGELGQARRYRLDPRFDPEEEMEIYRLRAMSVEPIVRAFGWGLVEMVPRGVGENGNTGICASNNYIGVVTERIQYLLADLTRVPFNEAMYILKESLKGFQHLYPRAGPVHITNKMIAINTQNQIKVWVNEDFSKNHPNSQIPSLVSTRNQKIDRQYNMIAPQYRDQKQMVENLLDVIWEKVQPRDRDIYADFFPFARENSYSFKNAQRFLSDYIIQRRVLVPNAMQHRNIQTNSYDIEQVVHQLNRKNSIQRFLQTPTNIPQIPLQNFPPIPQPQPQSNIPAYHTYRPPPPTQPLPNPLPHPYPHPQAINLMPQPQPQPLLPNPTPNFNLNPTYLAPRPRPTSNLELAPSNTFNYNLNGNRISENFYGRGPVPYSNARSFSPF